MADWVEEQIVKHEWTGNVDNISYGQILVRCKDCKHYDGDENIGLGTCLENGVCSTPDWFCADGERRKG